MIWTDARINVLREMWPNPECSGATIAACLGGGLTRMAVIGKAHRLGLAAKPKRNPSMQPKAIYRRELHTGKHRRPKKPAQQLNHIRTVQLPAVDLPFLPPPDVVSEPCSLLELTNDRCRWPIGDVGQPDFHFCGARNANLARGRSYCSTHAAFAYSSNITRNNSEDRTAEMAAATRQHFDAYRSVHAFRRDDMSG